MKAFFKQTIYILTLFISASALSQKTVYENKSFEELASDHKELAIIPFHVLLNWLSEKVMRFKMLWSPIFLNEKNGRNLV